MIDEQHLGRLAARATQLAGWRAQQRMRARTAHAGSSVRDGAPHLARRLETIHRDFANSRCNSGS